MTARQIFFRRQSDPSLIVGRIIDPRPGVCALLMDPFVPCVTHWCTIYPSFHVVLRPRQKDERLNDMLRDAIVNLQTCFSGSENTQELLLRVKNK